MLTARVPPLVSTSVFCRMPKQMSNNFPISFECHLALFENIESDAATWACIKDDSWNNVKLHMNDCSRFSAPFPQYWGDKITKKEGRILPTLHNQIGCPGGSQKIKVLFVICTERRGKSLVQRFWWSLIFRGNSKWNYRQGWSGDAIWLSQKNSRMTGFVYTHAQTCTRLSSVCVHAEDYDSPWSIRRGDDDRFLSPWLSVFPVSVWADNAGAC